MMLHVGLVHHEFDMGSMGYVPHWPHVKFKMEMLSGEIYYLCCAGFRTETQHIKDRAILLHFFVAKNWPSSLTCVWLLVSSWACGIEKRLWMWSQVSSMPIKSRLLESGNVFIAHRFVELFYRFRAISSASIDVPIGYCVHRTVPED